MYKPEIIRDLIKLGANLKVTGAYSSEHLIEFVRLSKEYNTTIIIKAEGLRAEHLRTLAKIEHSGLILDI